jgi:hypothetical protein
MKSANEYARDFLSGALEKNRDRISNIDLHQYVGEKTGQTRQVISGTLDGTGPHTLVDSDWYISTWHKEKQSNNRVVHCRNLNKTGAIVQRESDYDFPAKRKACETIMSFLPKTGKPRLLTLAGASGNCVRAALQRNPGVKIENVESDPRILELWKITKIKLGLTSIDYLCTLQDFVKTAGFLRQYDLINADCMGYASKLMYQYLSVINENHNTEILALTTQYLNGFRNHSPFQTALRKEYKNYPDAHVQCITEWLTNYEMIERFDYQKDTGTRRMEVLIYRRGV